MHVVPEWIKWYSEHFNLQAVKGHIISMRVILEWIKWYSEGFNLQAAIDGMATGVVCAGKNTGWRGGSTTTTESSQPMTQVNPIWMNIQ